MLAEKISKALNIQLAMEEQNSRIYLQMAGYCDANGYRGIAKWLYVSAEDEHQHMMDIAKYLADRNCMFMLKAQAVPEVDYQTLDIMFRKVMDLELATSQNLKDLYLMCLKEGDAITSEWLNALLIEQIEEEDKVQAVLDFIKLTGLSQPGLALLDEKVRKLA